MEENDEPKRQEISYSYANLPLSMQAATDRLDELEGSIAMIEADIEARSEREFPDAHTYDEWKFSASRALGYKVREKRFLIHWVEKQERKAEEAEKTSSDIEKRKALNKCVTEFFRLVTPYTPVFSDENKPKSIIDARRRRDAISRIKVEYNEFLGFLREESARMECPKRYMQGARSRVVRVHQGMEGEIFFLKSWMREERLKNPVKQESDKGSDRRDALPTPDPRLRELGHRLGEIKRELNMNTVGMVMWLYELIMKHKDRLVLDEQEISRLEGIDAYVRASKERLEIEPQAAKPLR